MCVYPDAAWEFGDSESSSAGAGSAQEMVGLVGLIFICDMLRITFECSQNISDKQSYQANNYLTLP